jgi:hypothetical protein
MVGERPPLPSRQPPAGALCPPLPPTSFRNSRYLLIACLRSTDVSVVHMKRDKHSRNGPNDVWRGQHRDHDF